MIQSLSFGKNNNNFVPGARSQMGSQREKTAAMEEKSREGEVHEHPHHPAAGTTSGQGSRATTQIPVPTPNTHTHPLSANYSIGL